MPGKMCGPFRRRVSPWRRSRGARRRARRRRPGSGGGSRRRSPLERRRRAARSRHPRRAHRGARRDPPRGGARGSARPEARRDTEGYTEDDVAVARAGLVLLEWGLPLSELLDLARTHDQAMRGVAERAVHMFDTYVRAAGAGPDGEEKARRLVEAFEALLPATATLVSHHFTRVLCRSPWNTSSTSVAPPS